VRVRAKEEIDAIKNAAQECSAQAELRSEIRWTALLLSAFLGLRFVKIQQLLLHYQRISAL
jgi:hypothetical protein